MTNSNHSDPLAQFPKNVRDDVNRVVTANPRAALGGGVGAAIGAALGGPLGAALGGALGGSIGNFLDREDRRKRSG